MIPTPSKFTLFIEGLFTLLLLGIPLLLVFSGSIGVALHDVFHPDDLVWLGLGLLALVTFFAIPIFLWKYYQLGWQQLTRHQRIFTVLYSVALLVGLLIWWVITTLIPSSWLTWLAPLG